MGFCLFEVISNMNTEIRFLVSKRVLMLDVDVYRVFRNRYWKLGFFLDLLRCWLRVSRVFYIEGVLRSVYVIFFVFFRSYSF